MADKFGDHTTSIEPPFKLWVDTFRPELEGKRWYHRFSALTATAGGFDVKRDVLTGHGPLGALYPTNTTHPQKEGDTMTFLYLVPTGMNDPEQPAWGSWAGRYGKQDTAAGRAYYWANQADVWKGTKHRDNTLAVWAADFQNDFRARLVCCVKPPREVNHPPRPAIAGKQGTTIVEVRAIRGEVVRLDATGTTDPDSDLVSYNWWVYPEAGSYGRDVAIDGADAARASLKVPADAGGKTIHVILTVRDKGDPPLARYRRVVIRVGDS
ncbi:MAG: DUF1593 domain-containing protein [Planctomycetia bacterium]|nr:DUF1593 domain-containing protein [Planctomycetia bacterium]